MHRLIPFLVVGTLLSGAGSVHAGVDEWTSIGPEGGLIHDLAIHRASSPEILYAATFGGLFRSLDGGSQWQQLSDDPFSVLLTDPTDPAIIYGAAGDQIQKSINGGLDWTTTSTGLGGGTVTALAIDPNSSSTLYAGTYAGVFKSTDAAASWTASSSGMTDLLIGALVVDPNSSSTLYAGTDSGSLFKSTNGGASWASADLGFSGSFVTALAVSPTNSSTVWASGSSALFKSINGGASWTNAGLGRITAIGLSATSPNVIYAWENIPSGGSGFRRSTNGGQTWQNADQGTPPSTSAERFVLGKDGSVFAATSRGVYKTPPGSVAWSDVSRGLVATFVRSVAIDAADVETLYAATFSSGLFRSTDGGDGWTRLETGASDFNLSGVATHPSIPGLVYALEFPQSVFRSADHGANWSPWSNGLEGAVALTLTVAESGTVYVGTQSQGVYQRSPTDGVWRRTADGMGDAEIRSILLSPADPNRIYGSGSNGIFRSTDAAATWQAVGADLLGPLVGPAVDPSDPDVVIAGGQVAAGSGVVRSVDGGESWQRVSTRFTNAVAFDPVDPNLVYARAARSFNGGATWTTYADDPRLRSAVNLTAASSGTLYAGTVNHGLFRLDPQPVLTLHDGRFLVEAEWRDFEGQVGSSVPVQVAGGAGSIGLRSAESTVLEFFDGDNWEMLVKVLDGRPVNGSYWVFTAAATDVAYTTTVTDTSCNEVRQYENPLGVAADALTDTAAFTPCDDHQPPSCIAAADTICLGEEGRFQVEVEWTDFAGESGRARQVELASAGLARSRDSGLLYFFDENNWEVLVKVLDGCDTNGFFWVFSAATTNVEYTLRVTDTLTGQIRVYSNLLGTSAPAVSDTSAFEICAD